MVQAISCPSAFLELQRTARDVDAEGGGKGDGRLSLSLCDDLSDA